MEIVFDVTHAEDGTLVAKCRSHDIETTAEDFSSLCSVVQQVVQDYFIGQVVPKPIRLNFK